MVRLNYKCFMCVKHCGFTIDFVEKYLSTGIIIDQFCRGNYPNFQRVDSLEQNNQKI